MVLSYGAEVILTRLESQGYRAWLVGGCVRDTLRGVAPADYDIATTALPQQAMDCFPTETVVPTGLRHGTITVVVEGERVEVTTLRADGPYSDGRHPGSVTFVSDINADLARRDFTVNAMAWSQQEGYVDPFGGQADLQKRVLRCVGEPMRRLEEDHLRILRALRFAACLEFEIDPPTAEALRRCCQELRTVSAERITVELWKLFCGADAGQVVFKYKDILSVVLPEIIPNIDRGRLLMYPTLPLEPVVRLAVLVGSPDQASAVAARLRLSREENHRLTAICGLLPEPWPEDERLAAWRVIRAAACHRVDQLAIHGSDLRDLGFADGPPMGVIMKRLLTAVVEGNCENEREHLLEFASLMW